MFTGGGVGGVVFVALPVRLVHASVPLVHGAVFGRDMVVFTGVSFLPAEELAAFGIAWVRDLTAWGAATAWVPGR